MNDAYSTWAKWEHRLRLPGMLALAATLMLIVLPHLEVNAADLSVTDTTYDDLTYLTGSAAGVWVLSLLGKQISLALWDRDYYN